MKRYKLYKIIITILLYVYIITFPLQVATLIMPLKTVKKYMGGTPAYFMRKVDFWASPNSVTGNFVTLSQFKSDSLNTSKEGKMLISSKKGGRYRAYYSPEFGRLRIQAPDTIAGTIYGLVAFWSTLSWLIIIIVLYIVRKILMSLETGSPFKLSNSRYVAILSLILFCTPLLELIFNYILEWYVESAFYLSFRTYPGFPDSGYICLFCALIFGILAYVIKRGVAIENEHALTI